MKHLVPELDRFIMFAQPEMYATQSDSMFAAVSALGTAIGQVKHREEALVALLALLDRCKSLNEDTLLILDEYRLAILVAIERALGDGDRVAREPAECDLDELEEQLRARLQRAWGPE